MALVLPDLVEEPTFFPLLSKLAECLCRELEESGGPKLCYCGLMIGTEAEPLGFMDCNKECGVAWVRPSGAFPSISFPAPYEEGTTCATPLAMSIEVGVARCAPRPQGRAMYPDPQDIHNALRLYMSDMRAAHRALACCLGSDRDVELSVGTWSPLEVAGGVGGGVWTATIAKVR